MVFSLRRLFWRHLVLEFDVRFVEVDQHLRVKTVHLLSRNQILPSVRKLDKKLQALLVRILISCANDRLWLDLSTALALALVLLLG